MFVNEFLFSFLLLAFTALLCLLGFGLLLDGIARFLREGYKERRRTKSAAKSAEERVTTAERAA
jgi:hypothetical protein